MEIKVKCVKIEHESTRQDQSYCLSLNIAYCTTLHHALDIFFKPELLTDSQRISVENHGLQDAFATKHIKKFPPILKIHLQRFYFDAKSAKTIKNTQRLEFPLELDTASLGTGKEVYRLNG
jgi:ubiquitin carboxyl-terminal hydrolase 7